MVAEGLTPRTVNTHLSLLGTILNAAVDDDYLACSPLLRKSGAGRTATTATSRSPAAKCGCCGNNSTGWPTRSSPVIGPWSSSPPDRHALGELVALRWDGLRFDQPLDDGAVRGPGRLRIARAISDPRRTGDVIEKGPRPRPASG